MGRSILAKNHFAQSDLVMGCKLVIFYNWAQENINHKIKEGGLMSHSMLTFIWLPIKVFQADLMLLSIRKSWRIFPIQQKFDTMAAFLYSKNSETRLVSSSKTCYHCADLVLRRSKTARWYSFSGLSKLIWF